jgi:hypothetical protein
MPGGDNWTCTLRSYHVGSFLSVASGNDLALAAANRWVTFRNTQLQLFGGTPGMHAHVDGVTLREITDGGVTAAQYEKAPTTSHVATAQAQSMPNQCALAISLLTDRAGRTGKGRVYLPCLAVTPTNLENGQLTTSGGNLTTIAVDFKTMIDGLNTDLTTHFGSALKLAVLSPTAAKQVFDDDSLADYNGAVITSIRVGTGIDTQRRRRASLKEIYLSQVIA